MKKISSTFKLVLMLLSKSKVKEIFLMAEVVIMFFLISLVLVPINNALILANGIESVSNGASMVYCVPAPSNPNPVPVEEVHKMIEEISGTTPKVFLTKAFTYTTQENSGGYLILTSNDLFFNAKLELKESKPFNNQDDSIPVLISSHLAQKYGIGDIIKCSLEDGKTIKCYVTGILKRNSTLIDVHKQEGSILTLDAIGFNMAKYDGDFIIATSNSKIGISMQNSEAAIFSFEQGTNISDVVNRLNESYSNFYKFHSVESLRKNTIANGMTKMEWRMVLMFLFTITVLFNFVAYIVINTHQKMKILNVMNILGLSFSKSVAINIISLLLVVLPALLVGSICSPYILDNMNIEYYGFNAFLGIAMATILISVVLIAVITSMWQRKHIATINIYKKG